ncbi:MAG: Bug family tripartite tricarboxylate transporter substrate binding protein, partial [Bacillota bacterium]
MRHAFSRGALGAFALALVSLTARAVWPDHPIHWVVPFAPGGANDLIARAAADGVSRRLKQPIIIENKPGAGTAVGTDYVAKSKPDGYTFLIASAGNITNSFVRNDLPYKDDDLVPVGMIAVAPSVIVVNPSVPANNLKEFVAWAKTQKNGVTWSTAGIATT